MAADTGGTDSPFALCGDSGGPGGDTVEIVELRAELAQCLADQEDAQQLNNEANARLNSAWAESASLAASEQCLEQEKAMRRRDLLASQKRFAMVKTNLDEQRLKDPTRRMVQELDNALKARKKSDAQLALEHEGLRRRVAGQTAHVEDLQERKRQAEAQLAAEQNLSEEFAASRRIEVEIREANEATLAYQSRAAEAWAELREVEAEEEADAMALKEKLQRYEYQEALQEKLATEVHQEELATAELRQIQTSAEEAHRRSISAARTLAQAQGTLDETWSWAQKESTKLSEQASRLQRAEKQLQDLDSNIADTRASTRRLLMLALVTLCVVDGLWRLLEYFGF